MSEDAPIYGSLKVAWPEISQAARQLCTVWRDGTELDWVKQSWHFLSEAGMTRYDHDLGRIRVLLRLLTLAMMYREFCQLGRDEPSDDVDVISEAIDLMEISHFRIAQLVGAEFDLSNWHASDRELTASAIAEHTDHERTTICAILLKGFGHEGKLATALFATTPRADQFGDDEDYDEPGLDDEDEINASQVIEWIITGMNSL